MRFTGVIVGIRWRLLPGLYSSEKIKPTLFVGFFKSLIASNLAKKDEPESWDVIISCVLPFYTVSNLKMLRDMIIIF